MHPYTLLLHVSIDTCHPESRAGEIFGSSLVGIGLSSSEFLTLYYMSVVTQRQRRQHQQQRTDLSSKQQLSTRYMYYSPPVFTDY